MRGTWREGEDSLPCRSRVEVPSEPAPDSTGGNAPSGAGGLRIRWWRQVLLGAMVIASAAGLGCAGGGRIDITPLDYRNIDPPAPAFSRINVERCYWWTDGAGQLWLALEHNFQPWFAPQLRFQFLASLALEKPPAGKARNYSIGARELRAVAHVGPVEVRFVSVTGIVAIYRQPHEGFRGSARILVTREVGQLLGGWSAPLGFLLLGDFEAVHDPEQGKAIAAATEAEGWTRPARAGPTSRPVQSSPAASQRVEPETPPL